MEWKQLWDDLSPEIKERFEKNSKCIDLKRGDYVYQQGETPKGLYFVKQGLVGLMMVGRSSGKEYLLRFFRQGQFFGHRALFSEEGYHGTSVAIEPTLLKLVPAEVVRSVMDSDPSLMRNVVRVLSKELRRCEEHQVMILENEILVRTAQALVYLKDLHPEHNWTRQEIANFCGSTASTVIKVMAELEAMGLIRQDGRSIKILKRDELIDLEDSQGK